MNENSTKYEWITKGDLNAFFALFLDNLVNLVIFASILSSPLFGFPKEFIYYKMIPGTALGVMFGDLVYTWLAFRLAKQTGNKKVTAMPLGLDTPSTIGLAVAVLGPAFLAFQGKPWNMTPDEAAYATWYLGMAVMIYMGLVKTVSSFFGDFVQRLVPTASLLGSLAGIGIVWLAAHQLTHVYESPFVGLLSMGIIVFTLMAFFSFPMRLPGAAMAVLLGTALFYSLEPLGVFEYFGHTPHQATTIALAFLPPLPQTGWIEGLTTALPYLSVAIPFGLLTIIGGINVTKGARLAGDDYNTREILLTEAVATLIAGFCGGVAQSTPYIGHSAYKMMGARAAYTLFAGLAIGLGSWFGLVGFLVDILPEAAVAPILIFVGFEILTLAFRMSPKRHAMAVAFAVIPSIINYGYIKLKSIYLGEHFALLGLLGKVKGLADKGVEDAGKILSGYSNAFAFNADYVMMAALGEGYVLTAMVWGAAVAFIIDRRIIAAAGTMFIASIFTFFGFMHSAAISGGLYFPGNLLMPGSKGAELPGAMVVWSERGLSIPYEFSLSYLIVAVALLAMYFFGPAKDGTGPAEVHDELTQAE